LYISGISYAGHYAPGLSAYLLKNKHPHINFKGMYINGPWIDADMENSLNTKYLYENKKYIYGQYLYYSMSFILYKIWKLYRPDISYDYWLFTNNRKDGASTIKNIMNINDTVGYNKAKAAVNEFWGSHAVQKELGVCCQYYSCKNNTIGDIYSTYDMTAPYGSYIEEVLKQNYPVALVYGDLDYTCQYYRGLKVAESLEWEQRVC
jgi:carboxypeptidase C (cathepsin A)